MRARVRASIREQAFKPGFISLLFNPFHIARKGLFQNIVALAPLVSGKVLDVGCGSKPYQRYFGATDYVGLEIEGRNKRADRFYDGRVFPCHDAEFDGVLTSQVLEHVFNPDEFLAEINRVLREDGLLLLTVPFVWDEHEQPFDYGRYSSFGLYHLLERYGFEVVELRKSVDDIRLIFQLINAYIYKKTLTRKYALNLLITLVLMAPFNVLGELLSKVLPKNSDLYLDNIVLARKRQSLLKVE